MSDHSPLQPSAVRQPKLADAGERAAFEAGVLTTMRDTGSYWAAYRLAIVHKVKRHKMSATLQRLKRAGLVVCDGQLWKAVATEASSSSGGAEAIADCETNQSPSTPSVGSVGR